MKQREIDAKENKNKQGAGGKKKKQQQEAEKEAKAKAEKKHKGGKAEQAEEAKEEVPVHPFEMKLADRKGRHKQMTELDEEMKQI